MSEKRSMTAFRLSDELLTGLEEYAKKHGESKTAIVQKALEQYLNKEWEERIAELFLEKWDKKHGAEMVRMKFAGTAAEVNSLILIEIANSILMKQGYSDRDFTPTEAVNNGIVWKAKKQVKDRLAKYKQFRDDKIK